MKKHQSGNVIVGIIIGVVLGLAAALAVAVYVTKVPVPFMNKGQSRTPEQDAAESRKNKDWDPNAPLYGKNPAKPVTPAGPQVVNPDSVQPAPPVATNPAPPAVAPDKAPPAVTGRPASNDPLGEFASAKAAAANTDPFIYFVQAGAFRTPEDAEAQRAKLSMMGIEAKVSEREQAGRQVWRVRVGPFEKKEEADRQKEKLEGGGIESALVRVQR
jgi:cell division protein FtsN